MRLGADMGGIATDVVEETESFVLIGRESSCYCQGVFGHENTASGSAAASAAAAFLSLL
jgi:hypothetical protein